MKNYLGNKKLVSKSSNKAVPKKFYDVNGNPVYPFVWRDAGPVDNLEEYFGY